MALGIGSFLDEFKTAMETRVAGLPVYTASMPPQDTRPQEGLSILRVRGGFDFLGMGPSYRDDIEVEGVVWAQNPDTTTDELGKPSRDRVLVLADAVVAEIGDMASGVYTNTNHAWLASYTWESRLMEPAGWRSEFQFTIAVIDLTP